MTEAVAAASVAPKVAALVLKRRRLPSAGFVTLCAVYSGVLAFFAWGLSTPDLDRVWSLHHELKAGLLGSPNGDDRAVLVSSLQRHPELASTLLQQGEIGLISSHSEGWLAMPAATIVRTAKAKERWLVLEVATPKTLLPFKVEVKGQGWTKQLEIKQHGLRGVELPALRAASELIVVKLKGHDLREDPSVLGVRITFSKTAPNEEGRS